MGESDPSDDYDPYDPIRNTLALPSFGCCDISNPKVLNEPEYKLRRTPFMVTFADSRITAVEIQKILESGMNIARFRMTYTTMGGTIRLLNTMNKAATTCSIKFGVVEWPFATCIELKTCIVRSGVLEEHLDTIFLNVDDEVILTCDILYYDKCNKDLIYVDNQYLTTDVKVGTEVSIGENVVLKCTEIKDGRSVTCVVIKEGTLRSLNHVFARGITHSRPLITNKDLQLLSFASEHQVDMVTVNYTRRADTIKEIKQFHKTNKTTCPLIFCGICTEEGLVNIDEIVKESDGIIFLRDYMTYELDQSKVKVMPRIQKWLGAKCIQAGKPFYLSGGVFEDALRTGSFYYSAISDVTNAIMDGVSGFILKNCDNVDLVVETINVMSDVCRTVEPFINKKQDFWRRINELRVPVNAAEAAAMICTLAANRSRAKVIVLPTVTGITAKLVLRTRPSCIIITVSTKKSVTRLLRAYACVVPLLYTVTKKMKYNIAVEDRINYAVNYAVSRSWLLYDDPYVVLFKRTQLDSYCDSVSIYKTTMMKKQLVECDEHGVQTGKSTFKLIKTKLNVIK